MCTAVKGNKSLGKYRWKAGEGLITRNQILNEFNFQKGSLSLSLKNTYTIGCCCVLQRFSSAAKRTTLLGTLLTNEGGEVGTRGGASGHLVKSIFKSNCHKAAVFVGLAFARITWPSSVVPERGFPFARCKSSINHRINESTQKHAETHVSE